MKTKSLILLTSCLLAGTVAAETKPARDYTMVDLRNGLTTKLLDVGTTSIVFSVKWPLDMEIKMGYLYLMGKFDIEVRGWSPLKRLETDPEYRVEAPSTCGPIEIDPARGEAVFEVRYKGMPWYYTDKEKFEKKAFFAVRVPVFRDGPIGTNRGLYEEDDEEDEEDEELLDPAEATPATEANGNQVVATASPPNPEEQLEIRSEEKVEIRDEESGTDAEPHKASNRRWLYIGIALFALCAIFYFLRKK